MKSKKTLLIFVICLLAFAIFAVIVITLFDSASNNPIDIISATYIRNSTDIQNKYGEIINISKNVFYETKHDEFTIKSPYTIQTINERIIVYVNLINSDGKWEAISCEIFEVIPNEH